jgi:hypothetical protein
MGRKLLAHRAALEWENMEFGVSPFPEPMRQVMARGSMFDVPVYRWLPAGRSVAVEYSAFIREERDMADDLPGAPES